MRPLAKIAPSLLSGDFAHLASECRRMLQAGADWLHVDIMDGHFVPNLTLGAPVVRSLRKHTDAYLDCHLMVSHPEQWVDDFAKAGASGYTFHIEAAKDAAGLCGRVRAAGMRCGVAVKPQTPIDTLLGLCDQQLVDLVLVMTVEPGFGGQSFMPETMDKVRTLRARYPHLDIQVDGGLSTTTIDAAAGAGANVIVAGTSIFGAPDAAQVISTLRRAVDQPAH